MADNKKNPILIDPWGSALVEDYEKLFKEFGLARFHSQYRDELDHYLFKREVVVAHRDFDKIFSRIKSKKPFIQMTGIASTGPLHLGHKVDIDLFKFFKSKGAKCYFAVTDIDAYVSRPNLASLEKAKEIAVNNIIHALALGLDKKDIYAQGNKEKRYYEFAFELSKKITRNMFEAIYGDIDLGKISANLLQYADILHPQLKEYEGKMPSLTGIGLEQDSHARIVRDLAKSLAYELEVPSFIYFKHQSGLQKGKKMSSSEPDTAIFLEDKEEDIKRKISKTFTGGRDTEEEQRKKGGRPEICKIYEIYKFHHTEDKFVEDIYKKCKEGKLMCGEDKKICINFLTEFLKKHQAKLKKNEKAAREIVYG